MLPTAAGRGGRAALGLDEAAAGAAEAEADADGSAEAEAIGGGGSAGGSGAAASGGGGASARPQPRTAARKHGAKRRTHMAGGERRQLTPSFLTDRLTRQPG